MGAPADPLILSQRSRIVRFAVEHRIPAMYEFREFVSDGGLLSYGPNLMEMFRRSATYADRILNGAKPLFIRQDHHCCVDGRECRRTRA